MKPHRANDFRKKVLARAQRGTVRRHNPPGSLSRHKTDVVSQPPRGIYDQIACVDNTPLGLELSGVRWCWLWGPAGAYNGHVAKEPQDVTEETFEDPGTSPVR
jgi:hypothetical protein